MKISNSKKQLAEIIYENGGWRDGIRAVYGAKTKRVCFLRESAGYPEYNSTRKAWVVLAAGVGAEFSSEPFANWHQTILSRDEYLHLYPAPDAAPDADVASLSVALDLVTDENKHEHVVEAKPTIEQLTADYRNSKDYAERKQQEADAAKADAEVKLAELVAAGKAHGLVLSVADTRLEPVINDWRDLRVGDRIWVGDSGRGRNCPEGEYEIAAIDSRDSDQPVGLAWPGGLSGVTWPQIHKRGWRFIRRPAKGGADA